VNNTNLHIYLFIN